MLAPDGTLSTSGTKVPVGVRVKWYQRAWTLFIDVEIPGIQSADVSITDDGQISIHALVGDTTQLVCLKLLHGVISKEWIVSTRSVKLELPKAGESRPHWERLTAGEKVSNIVVDWTSWMDEEEEMEVVCLHASPLHHVSIVASCV
ncbi:MAG: hypothetical protein SGPRY_010445 [Prymnesium sp.]